MMWIRSWHVERFGHLADHRVEGLEDGLNLILAPNEWGKTTTHRFLTWTLWGYPHVRSRELRAYRNTGETVGGTVEVVEGDRPLLLRRHLGDTGVTLVGDLTDAAPEPGTAVAMILSGEVGPHLEPVHSVATTDLDDIDLDDHRVRACLVGSESSGAGTLGPRALSALRREQRELLSPRGGRIRDLLSELDSLSQGIASAGAAERFHDELLDRRDHCLARAEALSEEVARAHGRCERLASSSTEAPAHTAQPPGRGPDGMLAATASAVATVTALVVAASMLASDRSLGLVLAGIGTLVLLALLVPVLRRRLRAHRRPSAPAGSGNPTGERSAALTELAELRERLAELHQTAGALGQRADDLAESVELAGLRMRSLAAEHELAGLCLDWSVSRMAELALDSALTESTSARQAVLQDATAWFERVTHGAWVGVELDGGRPSRVHRGGGLSPLELERLSRGAMDQLQLCIRIALARHSAARCPAPVLLDDVLVNADDARARVLAEAVAEVARATQVLLFTAHQHTVQLFDDLGSPATVLHTPRPGIRLARR